MTSGTTRFLLGALVAVATGVGQPGMAQQAPAALPPVDTVTTIELRLSDGSELIGRVVARDDTSLTLVTAAGLSVVVPRRALTGWRPVRGSMVRGEFRRSDPNTSRLFFTATGRTLPAGDGYFADYFLFFPFVAVGFTDYLTGAVGMSLIPGIESQLLYFAPKLGLVRSPEVNLAIGGIVATVPEEGSFGAAYTALTLGPEDQALTVLLGYPWGEGDDPDEPGFVIGGEIRTSRTTKLLAELWKVPQASEVPAVFGLRIFGERLAVDFGLVHVLGADVEGFPFIPWVDFVVNFSGGSRDRAPPRERARSIRTAPSQRW